MLQAFGCDSVQIEDPPLVQGPGPALGNFRFLGQSPKSSDVLVFAIDFIDEGGDLGDGEMQIWLQQTLQGKKGISLKPIFLQNELDPKAPRGSLRFVVQLFLSEPDLQALPFWIEVAVQFKDKAGNMSDKKTVMLQLKPQR
jgi:hypothetical protein